MYVIIPLSSAADSTRAVFVAQDPDSQSIVVAHQGTDPEKFLSVLNDAKFAQVAMNTTLFTSAAGEWM